MAAAKKMRIILLPIEAKQRWAANLAEAVKPGVFGSIEDL